MNIYLVIMVITGACLIMAGIFFNYNIYHLVKIDAEARGMKRPGLWAFFSLQNSDGSGVLPLYLIVRRKHPRRPLTSQEESDYQVLKKKARLALIMILVSAIPLVVTAIYYFADK